MLPLSGNVIAIAPAADAAAPSACASSDTEFLAHLVRSGALADARGCELALAARRRDGRGEIDWIGLTKLSPTRFVEELAAFYRCRRADRRDLLAEAFAGGRL